MPSCVVEHLLFYYLRVLSSCENLGSGQTQQSRQLALTTVKSTVCSNKQIFFSLFFIYGYVYLTALTGHRNACGLCLLEISLLS